MITKTRIVVKVGSSSIVCSKTNTISHDRISSIADDIAWLRNEMNKDVILMSSGSLAWGRICLKNANTQEVSELSPQLVGACGQIDITSAWASALMGRGLVMGQFLLSPEQVSLGVLKSAMIEMMDTGLIPYINENIPVMNEYDNDGLAAEIAAHLSCDTLVLLSDVDGVYTANPMNDPNANHIPEIFDIDDAIHSFGGGASSGIGTGGMHTKLTAAKKMKKIGVETVIASGEVDNPLRAIDNGENGTWIKL